MSNIDGKESWNIQCIGSCQLLFFKNSEIKMIFSALGHMYPNSVMLLQKPRIIEEFLLTEGKSD